MRRFSLETEQRRKLGLPAEVLAEAGWPPGTRVLVQVRRDHRVVLEPLANVLERFTGATPGLSGHAIAPEPEAQNPAAAAEQADVADAEGAR